MVAMSESGARRTESSSGRRGDTDVVGQLRQLKQRAAEVAENVGSRAADVTGQLKEKAAEMSRAVTDTIKDEAERLFDEQKGKAASKVARYGKVIHQAAHALHAVKADALAGYVDSAGGAVEGLTDYLEERTLAQVLEDTAEVARRHPGMMLGGMFVAGLAAARFLKASASRDEAGGDGDDGGEGEEERGGPSSRDRRR